MTAFRGPSREAWTEALAALDALAGRGGGSRAADLDELGDELFAVADVLHAQLRLRRALTDPSRIGDDRAALMQAVLGDRRSSPAADLLASTVRARWSSPRDLADAVELLAAHATAAAAERAGGLDDVEDELFRTGRVIAANPRLRAAFTDAGAPEQSRRELVASLLGGKVRPQTLRLVEAAVRAGRTRSVERAIEEYQEVAADRRRRLVASVTVAVPLTEQQRERLRAVLHRMYGSDLHLNEVVDPDVVGGVRVEVAGEVVDGSVTARLADARRKLTG